MTFVSSISHLQPYFDQLNQQHWPKPCLYIVATPIGNLADISFRALYALQHVDVIAAEDTRSSKVLLDQWQIKTPLIAVHRHNEQSMADLLTERLSAGESIALISDAGSPAISDPGGKIVAAVRAAGYQVVPIPGACAAISALMASGWTHDDCPSFCFAGFAPNKSPMRQKWLQDWIHLPYPVIFYEAPHRIQEFCKDLLFLTTGDREICLARELTKRFEQIVTLPLEKVQSWFEQDSHHTLGEFVVILAAASQKATEQVQVDHIVKILLGEGLSTKDAARIASKLTGENKKQVYARALVLGKSAE